MIDKKYRGLTGAEIKRIMSEGHTVSSRFIRCFVLFSSRGQARFAVVFAGKMKTTAVERNSLRRKVYEFVRLRYSDWSRPVSVVIILKSGCLGLSFDGLSAMLCEVFLRLGLGLKEE